MFDAVNFSLASALATNGTVTIGYPTGATKGDYDQWNDQKHVLIANHNVYQAPFNFSLAFNANASNITLTYLGTSTIPAGAACSLQLQRAGYFPFDLNDFKPVDFRKQIAGAVHLLSLGSPNALSSNGISASQSVTGAGTAFLLNGTGTDVTVNPNTSQGGIVLNTPRNVTAAWTGTAVITVTGFDYAGNAMQEASPSGTSFTGKKAWKTITSITTSASITGATVGYGNVLGLPLAIHNASQIIEEIFAGVVVGGAAKLTRQNFYFNQVDLLAGNPQPMVAPFAGTVTNVYTQVSVAITTGGTIVVKDSSTAMTGTTTIANSATALAQQTVAVTASNTVAKGDPIVVVPASFATAGALGGYVEFTPSNLALQWGTLVLADQSNPLTTTGDVRGTYTPLNVCDGTSDIALLVATCNPDDQGYYNYPATSNNPPNSFSY